MGPIARSDATKWQRRRHGARRKLLSAADKAGEQDASRSSGRANAADRHTQQWGWRIRQINE